MQISFLRSLVIQNNIQLAANQIYLTVQITPSDHSASSISQIGRINIISIKVYRGGRGRCQNWPVS